MINRELILCEMIIYEMIAIRRSNCLGLISGVLALKQLCAKCTG
jgi:hypothetical protein